jgi:hypothetical protein
MPPEIDCLPKIKPFCGKGYHYALRSYTLVTYHLPGICRAAAWSYFTGCRKPWGVERRCLKGEGYGKKQWWGLRPDFLSKLVALSNSMRLSLKKAAHAVLSGAA